MIGLKTSQTLQLETESVYVITQKRNIKRILFPLWEYDNELHSGMMGVI